MHRGFVAFSEYTHGKPPGKKLCTLKLFNVDLYLEENAKALCYGYVYDKDSDMYAQCLII